MSGFVAQPDGHDPEDPVADTVAGDSFWPGVSIEQFKHSTRASYLVDETRMRDALRGGMLTVRGELREWKAGHVALGAAELADIDAEEVDGANALVLLYQRAVFAHAAADLIESHNPVSATNEGRERIEDDIPSAHHFRRIGTLAIRDIKGATRTAVELI